jgi:hypothetical protein
MTTTRAYLNILAMLPTEDGSRKLIMLWIEELKDG